MGLTKKEEETAKPDASDVPTKEEEAKSESAVKAAEVEKVQ